MADKKKDDKKKLGLFGQSGARGPPPIKIPDKQKTWATPSGAAASGPATSFAQVENEQKEHAKNAEELVKKWPCADDLFPNLTSKTTSKEVWRGYCMLRQATQTRIWQHVAVHVNRNPGKLEMTYKPKQIYDQSKLYHVTLPAVMLFHVEDKKTKVSDDQYNDYEAFHLMKNYRHQFGVHLLANYRFGNVHYIHCHWLNRSARPDLAASSTDSRVYHADLRPRSVNCVYPCQRTTKKTQELVLGLAFCNSTKSKEKEQAIARTRTFAKLPGQQKPNEHCFDVTESFIAGTDNECSFKEETHLFPKDRSASVFYVCRGAKLVVTDERYDGQKENVPNAELSHCRNLFLEGSLVVVSGQCCPSISTILDKGKDPSKFMPWKDFHQHYLRPDHSKSSFYTTETNVDSDAKDQTIAGNQRMVYFLGAVESEHNSVCWKLEVKNDGGKTQHRAELFVPEGGYFEDITSWRYGFQLIRSRHCYQRLFESVLEMANAGTSLPAGPFQVPPPEILDRILFINGTDKFDARQTVFWPDYKALKIPQDFETMRPDTDRDLRRYMALHFLNNARAAPPAVQPVWIHNQSIDTSPGWQKPLPSPPLYPNCFQTDSAGNFEMVVIDRGLRVVRIDQVAGASIQNMSFGIIDQDRTDRVLHQTYKLYPFGYYGHYWESNNDPKNPGRSRLGRDYRWQKWDSSSDAQQPKMKGLLLVKTDLVPVLDTLPWVVNNRARELHRFGYTDNSGAPDPARREYPLNLVPR